MKVKSLGAVFVRVRNLEESVRFYSEVLHLELRDIEDWDNGRGANYIIGPDSPLLTLIESIDPPIMSQPTFNLFCENILDWYEHLKNQGVRVGSLNKWSSEWNDHMDFDVYDPDGHAINLIEWKSRA